MGLREFFRNLKSTPALLPQLIRVPAANTDHPQSRDGAFEEDKHYFTVRVNEMFLSQQRKWFIEIVPTVVCLTGYLYGDQEIENPFIVSQKLMEAKMENVPNGMVFRDTRVAGIHPYKGGRLIISIVLCQSVAENYIANTFEFIENISGVLSENITNLVGNYIKIANVVIGGIDKLFNAKIITPLFGYRKEFDKEAGDTVGPGFYVMVKSEKQYDESNFFIKENQLYYGNDKDTAKAFRDTEYVLFSLTRSTERNDTRLLPFYQSYKKILDELNSVPEVSQGLKDKVKAMLRALNIEVKRSPDVVKGQAQKIMDEYVEEVQSLIDPKYNFAGGKAGKKDEWDATDEKIAAL